MKTKNLLGNFSKTWRFMGELVGIVAIITFVVTLLQLTQSKAATDEQNSAQQTQVAIFQSQLTTLREIATLQFNASDPSTSSTSIAPRIQELQATANAQSTQIALLPLATEETNWTVTFLYPFPPDYWSKGTHIYTLESTCRNTPENWGAGKWVNAFQVTEGASLLSETVYLRLDGLQSNLLGGPKLDKIHISQSTAAAISFAGNTHAQADFVAQNCLVTISWDTKNPQVLIAGIPFQH